MFGSHTCHLCLRGKRTWAYTYCYSEKRQPLPGPKNPVAAKLMSYGQSDIFELSELVARWNGLLFMGVLTFPEVHKPRNKLDFKTRNSVDHLKNSGTTNFSMSPPSFPIFNWFSRCIFLIKTNLFYEKTLPFTVFNPSILFSLVDCSHNYKL